MKQLANNFNYVYLVNRYYIRMLTPTESLLWMFDQYPFYTLVVNWQTATRARL